MIQIIKENSAIGKDISLAKLKASTEDHIDNVRAGLLYFREKLLDAADNHDYSKLGTLSEFRDALVSGGFKSDTNRWFRKHILTERHHILNRAPDDVNLIDVMEYLTDCVMAGLARSGDIYPFDVPDALLQKAFKNTVELIKSNVEVVEGSPVEEEMREGSTDEFSGIPR